jgi:hypothetical protein
MWPGFTTVDTPSAPDMIMPALPYLRSYAVAVVAEAPSGSEVVVMNTRKIYESEAIAPGKGVNVLSQVRANGQKASFRLAFATPLESVTFTRPTLLAISKSGITHPAWTATALDQSGNVLSAAQESLIRSYKDIPARNYTLRAPGLRADHGRAFRV